MDLILCGCVQSMVALLNLFLDEKNLVMAGRSHHCLLQKLNVMAVVLPQVSHVHN